MAPPACPCGVRHADTIVALVAVLRDADAAGVVDAPQPVGAVPPESGQDYADRAGAEEFGHGAEERIGRGPHAPHRRFAVEPQVGPSGPSPTRI